MIVEPPFGNLCHHKGLDRFTLRGSAKVDGQWKLFALVRDIEKLALRDGVSSTDAGTIMWLPGHNKTSTGSGLCSGTDREQGRIRG